MAMEAGTELGEAGGGEKEKAREEAVGTKALIQVSDCEVWAQRESSAEM